MGTFKTCVAAFVILFSPACVGDSCACQYGVRDADHVRVDIPSTSGHISVPERWRFVTVPTGSGRVAAFAAATSEEVVDEFLTPPYKIKGIGPDDVTDKDAFVEIWITYLPDASLGEQRRIPTTFDLETLSATGEMLGQPILTVQGKRRGPSTALVDVRAWMGASASGADRDALQQTIESIEL